MTNEHFYDHFHQDKPTRSGLRFAVRFAQRIADFAGIQAENRVLEIGPGRGTFADVCLSRKARYAAVEPNIPLAEALEAKGVPVVRAMIPPVPSFGSPFDFVVMINLLEHMNSMKEALEVVRSVKAALDRQGKLVICCPDYLNMREQFFNCDFSHNYVTTQRRLSQLLTSAGFARMRSVYLAGPLSGAAAVVTAGIVARMPFGWFHAWFPTNRLCAKLYKAQLSLSRKVLIVAENSD
ncbi:MAG: class I SAM-dependent methyltransferase [Solirubrobacterales bacterium]